MTTRDPLYTCLVISKFHLRSVLATLAVNGTVHIQIQQKFSGKWSSRANITEVCRQYLISKNWQIDMEVEQKPEPQTKNVDQEDTKLSALGHMLNPIVQIEPLGDFKPKIKPKVNTFKSKCRNKSQFPEFQKRRHMLDTVCLCWCPVLLPCYGCSLAEGSKFDNEYYAGYYLNYARCPHSLALLATANRLGFIFIWLVRFNLPIDEVDVTLIFMWWTGTKHPTTISWYQATQSEGNKCFLS